MVIEVFYLTRRRASNFHLYLALLLLHPSIILVWRLLLVCSSSACFSSVLNERNDEFYITTAIFFLGHHEFDIEVRTKN